MSKKENIVKYKKHVNFNIGFVIFLIIIVYVLFNIFSYFTTTHIAEYQVQQGTIASNYVYQGVILRDETIEYADKSGYINYYVKNAERVSVTDIVYSIDTTGNIYEKLVSSSNVDDILSTDTVSLLSSEVDSFIKDYDGSQFLKSYTFYNNLYTEITQDINANTLAELSDEVSEAVDNNTFFQISSSEAGIIVYEIDGFENYSIEDITSKDISYSNYTKTYLYTNQEVEASDPVYKRINSENWNIIIPIDKDLAAELDEKSSIDIRFCKDDYTTNASCSIIKENESYYLNLSLKKAMIRYVNDRFIDVELVLNDTTGLKIPQTSITTKEFFTIPKEYFTVGGDSSSQGLLVRHTKNNETTVQIVNPTIYYETDEYYYIDSEYVSAGDVVLKSDSSSTYVIGKDTDSLVGVYNINKGYAVFKQINIIYENNDYAIVETKTAYGIALYDHIALDASNVTENQLTSK